MNNELKKMDTDIKSSDTLLQSIQTDAIERLNSSIDATQRLLDSTDIVAFVSIYNDLIKYKKKLIMEITALSDI